MSTTTEDIKKMIQTQNVLYGTNEVLKKVRQGKIAKIYLAANIPENIEEDFTHNAEIAEVEIEKLQIPNDELGLIFKRVHPILAIGIMKE